MGPGCQLDPLVSETKQGTVAWDGAELAELIGGYVSGEANDTGMFLATIRTYLYPFPNRYHALAMTASAMADSGAVAAAPRQRRVPIALPKLDTSFTVSLRS